MLGVQIMTTVILAEKPSQARAYVAAFQKSQKKAGYYEVSDPVLPNDTLVTHALGHLVELVPPEKYDAKYRNWALANLPIFPANYQFEVIADKQKQFQVVKMLLNRADTIIVAGDNGREGENIAWSIMKQAKIDVEHKTMQRLWINSLEKEAIIAGFHDLKDGWQFYPNYQEAQTRQISDWLVGMNASPLYTLLLRQHGLSGVYAIGRVQTPTLYMIYQRDQLIKNFESEPYLELNAEILANQQKFEAKLGPYQRFKDEKGLTIFMQAKSVQRGPQTALIKDVQNIVKKPPSPRLFSLSSLQSAVNQRFHASASETLAAVQALYEAKLLTYPRTDSEYLTKQEFDYLAANLDQYQELLPEKMALPQTTPQKRYVNGQKVTEHPAIIMTKVVPSSTQLAKLPVLQRQVYDLVLKTTLAMFAGPYEYTETTIITQVGQALFKSVGKVPINPVWQRLLKAKSVEQGKDTLPVVTPGQIVQAVLTTPTKQTTPPKPFTEGTLITAMKTAGKTLDADEAAVLKDVEGIGTEATRANVLETLKRRHYLVTNKNELHVSGTGVTLCQAVALEPLLTSPSMTAKWELALKEIGEEKRTPENFLGQIKLLIQKLLKEVPEQFAQNTDLQTQLVAQQQVAQKQQAQAAVGVCPVCKTGEISDRGKFYGCSNYRQGCHFSLPKQWSGKKLPISAIKQLIKTGETAQLKGFKSKKTGKAFSAKLKLVAGKLSFDFN